MFKTHTKGVPDVLESLLQAAEKQDFKTLALLCGKHRKEIRESFVVWSKVPDVVRKNPVAMNRYCEGLIAVAQGFERNGDASLLSHLARKDSENPLVQWHTDLVEAQALIDRGKLSEAIVLLNSILSKNAKLLGGSGVEHYLPRTYGMLGSAYFKSNEQAKAVECMSKAKAQCEKSGDTEGAAIYEGNLRHLEKHA
jgi:hypothetical protein